MFTISTAEVAFYVGVPEWNGVPERNYLTFHGTELERNGKNTNGTELERNEKLKLERLWNGTKWEEIKGGTELERNEKNAWNDFPERNGDLKGRSNGLIINPIF